MRRSLKLPLENKVNLFSFQQMTSRPSSLFEKAISHKMVLPENLASFCNDLKEAGKTIVTLNGGFDLLHPGHFEMIYGASCQADILLMLLNTDASIRTYKNQNRPINSLEIRLKQIAVLEMVDYVSWFEEIDPREVLSLVKPDVHVNGSEYGENCIESEIVKNNGGKIHIFHLVEGHSSTNLIQRIRSLCD